MKKGEFLLEFTKALKSKDDVAILHYLISDPFSVRTCVNGNPDLHIYYNAWKTNNSFICRMLTENEIYEDISIAHNIFRETIEKRAFGTGSFSKDAHEHVDFLSRWRGFMQTKNKNEYTFNRLFKDWNRYEGTVNCIDIFARKNKIHPFDHTKIEKPNFNIVLFNTLRPINYTEIQEVQTAFYENKSSIIEMHETQMKPLLKAHKNFIENSENMKIDFSTSNLKFKDLNASKNILEDAWNNFQKTKIIEY